MEREGSGVADGVLDFSPVDVDKPSDSVSHTLKVAPSSVRSSHPSPSSSFAVRGTFRDPPEGVGEAAPSLAL